MNRLTWAPRAGTRWTAPAHFLRCAAVMPCQCDASCTAALCRRNRIRFRRSAPCRPSNTPANPLRLPGDAVTPKRLITSVPACYRPRRGKRKRWNMRALLGGSSLVGARHTIPLRFMRACHPRTGAAFAGAPFSRGWWGVCAIGGATPFPLPSALWRRCLSAAAYRSTATPPPISFRQQVSLA